MTLTDDGEGAQHFIVVLDAVGVVVVNGLQSLGDKNCAGQTPIKEANAIMKAKQHIQVTTNKTACRLLSRSEQVTI